jgi:hypothetical protein
MVLVDFEKELLIAAQLQPSLQRMQQLIPICSEYVVRLMWLPLSQRIAPRYPVKDTTITRSRTGVDRRPIRTT